MGAILRLIIPILAGVGGGAVLDKVAADKLPAYPGSAFKDETTGGFNVMKIAYFIGAAVVSTYILKFIGKKLNIKILK